MPRGALSLSLALGSLLIWAGPVCAQTPEPTPTPTPAWQQVVTLASGNALLIERRITYGEIAVVAVILGCLLFALAYMAVSVAKKWFPS